MSFSCYLFKRFPVCRFVIILSFVLISSTAIIISFSSAGATESTPINRVDDYLDAPNVGDALAGGAFSVSAWIKPTLLPDDINVPLSLRTSAGAHRQQIGYTPAGNFTYYDATIGWRFTGDTYPPNAWYFVTLVLDGAGNGILDVDGVPQTTFTTPVRPQSGDMLSLGHKWENGQSRWHFTGLIDEVALYDRSLHLPNSAS